MCQARGRLHCIVFLEGLDELSNSGMLLNDSDVDTAELFLPVFAVIPPLLVEDGIDCDCSLAGLMATNDKFTLANGHHGINGLKTSHYRLIDGMTGQDTRSLEGGTSLLSSLNGTLAVNWVTESIDDTTKRA